MANLKKHTKGWATCRANNHDADVHADKKGTTYRAQKLTRTFELKPLQSLRPGTWSTSLNADESSSMWEKWRIHSACTLPLIGRILTIDVWKNKWPTILPCLIWWKQQKKSNRCTWEWYIGTNSMLIYPNLAYPNPHLSELRSQWKYAYNHVHTHQLLTYMYTIIEQSRQLQRPQVQL